MATILSFMEVGDVQYVHVHSKLKATCNLSFYRVSILSVWVLHSFKYGYMLLSVILSQTHTEPFVFQTSAALLAKHSALVATIVQRLVYSPYILN